MDYACLTRSRETADDEAYRREGKHGYNDTNDSIGNGVFGALNARRLTVAGNVAQTTDDQHDNGNGANQEDQGV